MPSRKAHHKPSCSKWNWTCTKKKRKKKDNNKRYTALFMVNWDLIHLRQGTPGHTAITCNTKGLTAGLKQILHVCALVFTGRLPGSFNCGSYSHLITFITQQRSTSLSLPMKSIKVKVWHKLKVHTYHIESTGHSPMEQLLMTARGGRGGWRPCWPYWNTSDYLHAIINLD